MEVRRNLRIKARAARHQITHLLAQGFVDLTKHNWTGVDSHLAQRAIESHQTLKHFLGESSSFFNFLEDALVNQIKELRHNGESGDVTLLQSS